MLCFLSNLTINRIYKQIKGFFNVNSSKAKQLSICFKLKWTYIKPLHVKGTKPALMLPSGAVRNISSQVQPGITISLWRERVLNCCHKDRCINTVVLCVVAVWRLILDHGKIHLFLNSRFTYWLFPYPTSFFSEINVCHQFCIPFSFLKYFKLFLKIKWHHQAA